MQGCSVRNEFYFIRGEYFLISGVCHGDDMMYIFNYRIPFLLCDVAEVGGLLYESDLPRVI